MSANLETTYLGLKLKNPVVMGASPVTENLDAARRIEDAGAAAIVLHSLFEEQVLLEQRMLHASTDWHSDTFGEAQSFFPKYEDYRLAPDRYLTHISTLKRTLGIPVIASLNGRTDGDWVDFAAAVEQAGADALEINTYFVVTDVNETPDAVERRIEDIVRRAKSTVKRLPVSVKLTTFHSSLPHLGRRLENAGASGLVLFNRFYQSDFDIDEMNVVPQVRFSESGELLTRLRWLAILSSTGKADLACSGGVHTPRDLIKAILAGANVAQVVSAVFKQGPAAITVMLNGLRDWMDERGYADLAAMRGALNLTRCPDSAAHERAHYIRNLQSVDPWAGLRV